MRTPLLAVAGLTVNLLIGTITGDDRVERLRTIVALEALAMPFASF